MKMKIVIFLCAALIMASSAGAQLSEFGAAAGFGQGMQRWADQMQRGMMQRQLMEEQHRLEMERMNEQYRLKEQSRLERERTVYQQQLKQQRAFAEQEQRAWEDSVRQANRKAESQQLEQGGYETAKAEAALAYQQAVRDFVSILHPDWEEVAQSTLFREWVTAQGVAYAQKLNDSWDPGEISAALTAFKAEGQSSR